MWESRFSDVGLEALVADVDGGCGLRACARIVGKCVVTPLDARWIQVKWRKEGGPCRVFVHHTHGVDEHAGAGSKVLGNDIDTISRS